MSSKSKTTYSNKVKTDGVKTTYSICNKEAYHMRAQKAEREKRCSEATHGEVEERGKEKRKKIKKNEKKC